MNVPRTKEQNEQIRRERMEAIMRAALKVYVEKGYASAEIGDVAKRSNMARGLVYYYYKDKLSLFQELFRYMIGKSSAFFRSVFEREEPVRELLETYVKSMLESMLKYPENILFWYRMPHDLNVIFTEEERIRLNWPGDYMSRIAAVMKRGMDAGEIRPMSPGLLATQYWGAVISGMRYLHEGYVLVRKDGHKADHIPEEYERDVAEAVANCMAIIR